MLDDRYRLRSKLLRRTLLKYSAVAVGATSIGSLLVGCRDEDQEEIEPIPTDTRPVGAAGETPADVEVTPTPAEEMEETPTPVGAVEASPTPVEEETPAATEPAETGRPREHVVEMNDGLEFVPDSLTINVGDTVTWRTVGTIPHTSTCDPELAQNAENVRLPEGAEPWDSGLVQQGQEFSHTIETPGEYTYFCIPHELQGMVATLTVEEA